MESGGSHIDDVKAIALEVLQALVQDSQALRRYAIEQLRWLTFNDVMDITGWSRNKLTPLVQSGEIPMFRFEGEWRITKEAWKKTEDRLIKKGMIPRNRTPKR